MSTLPSSSQHLAAIPAAPYGRESVLSTRSLSYLSTDAHGSPNLPPQASQSRNASANASRSRTRRSTLSESDYDLEMAEAREQELKDIPELPDSVADSPLFGLPREIRDRIYSFCLTSQNERQVQYPAYPSTRKCYALQPQILRTCRIVYSEAAPLLYTVNTMTFDHPSNANMFVRAMSCAALSRYINAVSLHIKAPDSRLWCPYFTSRDPRRSVKADFPSLRELNVRFRSNKWQPNIPPEANMKQWSSDSRLDEIINSLRDTFIPHVPAQPKTEGELEAWLSNSSSTYPLHPGDPSFQKQWLEIHKARAAFTAKKEAQPIIKVTCACRVPMTHYQNLTSAHPVRGLPRPNHGQQQSEEPSSPVKEGEPFRGFRAIDLQAGMRRLFDPEMGSVNVAQTPFADKNGVLLSLEIHCQDPKREGPGSGMAG